MRRDGRRLLVVAWLAGSACAHAPAAPPPPPVAWPAPPAAPLVRLAAVLSPGGAAPGRSGLGRLLDAVAGVEREAAPGERLVRPVGLAEAGGRAWAVADPDAPGVFLVSGDGLARVECPGAPWVAPLAVAAEPGGGLLVADAGAGRVVRAAGGGCRVVLDGLERPVAVASAGGRAFAIDGPRHEVVAAGPAGEAPLRFGADVLSSPVAMAATPEGHLLVADALAARVVRFAADGRVLGTLGGRAPEEGGLLRPKAVAADAAGRVFVLEASQDRIAVYLPDGRPLAHLGEPGAGPGRFSQATGLALAAGALAVVEAGGRIQIFELVGGTS